VNYVRDHLAADTACQPNYSCIQTSAGIRVCTDINGVSSAAPRHHSPLLHYSPWLLFGLGLLGIAVVIDPLIALGLGVAEVLTGAGYGMACRLGRGGAEIRARLMEPGSRLTDDAQGDAIMELLWGARSLEVDAPSEKHLRQMMLLYERSVVLTAANPAYRPVHQAAASLLLAHVVRWRETSRPGGNGGTVEEWRTVCSEIRAELRQIALALPEGDSIKQVVAHELSLSAQGATQSVA
jgi:hypothetical protein